jgi:flagellar protein FliO/FliZ
MEYTDYTRFSLALAFIVLLIWGLAYVAKRTGLDKRIRGATGQHGRMAVVDVLYLDPKRKMILVRADAREYLLFVAGDQVHVMNQWDKAS